MLLEICGGYKKADNKEDGYKSSLTGLALVLVKLLDQRASPKFM